jgi:TonB family protein
MEGIPVEQVVRVAAPAGPYLALGAGLSTVSGPLIEMTMNSSDFSTNSISDSVFAIPDGYSEGLKPLTPPLVTIEHSIAPPLMVGNPLGTIGGGGRLGPGSGGAVSGNVFSVGNGVSPPTLIARVDPEYSEEARSAKLSGSVLLSIIVDTEGHARDIRVTRSLGMGLDENAVEAVEKWKFKPGVKDGAPVNTRAMVEVNFRLLDPPQTQ